jgi:hypothetical protein
MILATYVDGMLQVTNHVVGLRLAGLTQKGHEIYYCLPDTART